MLVPGSQARQNLCRANLRAPGRKSLCPEGATAGGGAGGGGVGGEGAWGSGHALVAVNFSRNTYKGV